MAELNVNCIKDKYYDYSTFTGYGTGTTLLVGSKTSYNNGKYWANLAFDLSSIPANKRVTAAQLYVYVAAISGVGTKNLYAMGADDFQETSDSISLSSFGLTNIVLNSQGQYYLIDITTIVQQGYINGVCNLALGAAANLDTVVTGDIPTYTINSRENGTSKPYVKITYEDLPPNPPTNLAPASETKLNSQVVRFSWTHNPTQSGDTQGKFDLLWSSNGGSTWNTITQSTANQYYDMPANTLPVGSIAWKVKTYSASGVASEYSAQSAFVSAGKPNAPVLIAPSGVVNVSMPTVSWTGTGQVMYQVQILQGAIVVWDSGEVASSIGQAQAGALADNTNYTVKVRLKNQYDIWSDWTSGSFSVDFEVPNKPVISIVNDHNKFSARISISNPTPDNAGGFSYNDIYRREAGGAWKRIATQLARDSTYEDCAMKSGQLYEYKASVIGTYGYADSDTKYSGVKVKDAQLVALSDKSLYVPLRYDPNRNISISSERTLMKFAGRAHPVAEFGEHVDEGYSLSYKIESLVSMETLAELVRLAETLLYRDNRGRKVYCTIGAIDIEENEKYWAVSFSISEVSHQEEV